MAEHTPLHEQTMAAGAELIEEAGFLVPEHFGDVTAEYEAARSAAVLVDDSPRGKIEIQGADAARFLHNLTTNDILGLPPGGGCEAFLTTTKAKVVAYLLIYRHAAPGGTGVSPVGGTGVSPVGGTGVSPVGGTGVSPVQPAGFSLDVAPGAADGILQYLDRYLISEQVELSNHTTAFAQMHLAGPRSTDLLEQILAAHAPPKEPLQHIAFRFEGEANSWVRRHDALGVPGYDIVCPPKQAASLWQRLLQAGARPAGRQVCEILRIEAGLPRQGTDIDENTFAPEVGRIAETICYTKGCYLGQESIVMARDRGQVNRTLVGVKLAAPAPHDSRLFVGDKEVGRVTSSVFSPRLGTTIGLAYVRRGHQQPGTKMEVEAEGSRSPAEVVKLPIGSG